MDVDGSGFLPVAWYAAGPEGENAPLRARGVLFR